MSSRQLDEEAIFHVAREIPNPDARFKYLDQICGGEQALRERVEALLAVHEKEAGFLQSAPAELPATEEPSPLTERPGTTIGRYKLMEQIGEGGMGIVFVAEQERPIRRKVALKVIKPGMDSKAVVARFEAERQALAVMDHPNIAKVLDAGTTDSGHPYFVMELVRGIEMTTYCDEHKLTIRERLDLFCSVCQAIQHAHQKGIIHRDIKPSNVLVTEQDGKAIAKVIDFGVAKAIGQSLSDRTVYTSFQAVIGTPLYMSPEQAALSNVDVDTRSDVYSLGVLLYELVTGTTPFDTDTMKNAAQDEVLRIIREQEPQKPSTKISTLGNRAQAVSQSRRTDVAGLGRTVRGDLDWIVMKAMDKDRTRRYDSPSRLATDVGHFLGNAAIEARPPSTWYQLQKTLQRNKGVAATLLVVFLALAIGLGVALWGMKQARDTAQELRTQKEELQAQRNRYQRLLTDYKPLVLNEIYDRIFSGNVAAAEKAINDADAVGVPKETLAVLRGIQQVFSGEQASYREGISSFESILDEKLDDPIALSVLTWAHISGYGDLDVFAQTRQRHQNLRPPTDDRERVIWAAGLSVEENFRGISAGDSEGIKLAATTLEGVVERRNPSWKLPRLLLARVLSDCAVDFGDGSYVAQAIETHLDHLAAADSELLRSPFWLAQQLHIYSVATRLFDGAERAEYRGKAEQLADSLLSLGHHDYIPGRLERALFFTNVVELDGATDFSRAVKEWLVFDQQSKNDLYGSLLGGLLVRAGLITGDMGQAEEFYARFPLPFTAYFQGDRDATLAFCSELRDDETLLGKFWTHAVMYTCGQDHRDKALKYFKDLEANGEYPPWIDLPLQLFLKEVQPEEVPRLDSHIHRAWAMSVTGNYLVNDGRDTEAMEYFDKVIKADSFMMDVHQWAHAFLLRIERDPDWYQRVNPASTEK